MLFIQRDVGASTLLAADIAWLHQHYTTVHDALRVLSPTRRAKALSYTFTKDRELSVLSSMLLDWLLQQRGLCEKDMTYVLNEKGKPSLQGYSQLHFSIAHSGKVAAVIMGASPVGVDVEYLPNFPYDLADPFQWTQMECVGKLLGCGVGCYVDGQEFTMPSAIQAQHISLQDYLLCVAWENKATTVRLCT